MHGGRDFLAIHHEVAIAGKIQHGTLIATMLFDDASCDRGRHTVAHRTGGGSQLRAQSRIVVAVQPEAVRPGCEIASAIGQNRVGRQCRAQGLHHLP